MENFKKEIKEFAANILAGHNNDSEAAANSVKRLNELMTNSPDLVKILIQPQTEKKIRKVLPIIQSLNLF